jgi:DNA-binding PadR family transcriptional regulator
MGERDMPSKPNDVSSELPLTEAGFLILLSLTDRPLHGYLIMQTINTVFRTGFRMGPGTLYRTLQLQTKSGLIEEVDGDVAADADDSRRRYYALTPRGRTVVREELDRLQVLCNLASVRLRALHDA